MEPSTRESHNYFFSNLAELSNLPQNSDIHWSNNNNSFEITAKYLASVKGIQPLANWRKKHDPSNTVQYLNDFSKKLINRFQEYIESYENNPEQREKTTRKIAVLQRAVFEAINGKFGSGGLAGLAITYKEKDENLSKSITSVVNELKESIEKSLTDISIPKIPEEQFSDKDWEKTIMTSSLLPIEVVSIGKYQLYRITRFLNDVVNTIEKGEISLQQQLLGFKPDPKWNWWDKIGHFESADLYLGAIPLIKIAGRNDLIDLKNLGIKSVLSAVEVFENRDEGWLASTVSPINWKDADIKQFQLPTPDVQTVTIERIEQGIEFIHWNLRNSRSLYCHCKAGRGRSALILMCYLIKHHKYSAEDAFEIIKKARPQAGFSKTDDKYTTLLEFENQYVST